MSPLEFLQRLAALVPRPRLYLRLLRVKLACQGPWRLRTHDQLV